MNNGIIRTAIGAVVGIKVLETGMKVIHHQQKKIKSEGLLFSKSKKNDEWH